MWMDIAQDGGQEPRSDEEDTVYDRSNPFHSKHSPSSESETRIMLEEQETRCGIWSWRPVSLQKFANRSLFSVIFTVMAVIQCSFWSYYVSCISTFEKRFRMDSITSGLLICSNELAQIFVAILFTYFGFRRHRAKLLTLGVGLSALSCLTAGAPHYFLGSGKMASELTGSNTLPAKAALHVSEAEPLAFVNEDETLDPVLATTLSIDSVFNTSESSVSVSPEAINNTLLFNLTLATSTLAQLSLTNSTISTSTMTSTSITSEVNDLNPSASSSIEDAFTKHEELFPMLNDEMRMSVSLCARHIEHINAEETKMKNCKTKEFERKVAFTLIFFANIFGGVGSMFYLMSGGPFAEDSTILPNELPRIFGMTMAVRLIGAFFGYLFAWSCLSEFIHPFNEEVSVIDSRWLGAYWLGWTFLGTVCAIFAIVFSLFPRQAPKEFLKKRSLTHETGISMFLIPNTVPFFGGSELKAANLYPSLLSVSSAAQGLFRNKVYLLLTLSTITHVLFSVGYLTFFPKYLEFMFRVKAADAAMLTGLSNIPFQVAGLMLGGAFIARYLPSAKEILHWNTIVTALKIVGLIVMAFLGCNSNTIDVTFVKGANLTSEQHCSSDCDCEIGPVLPVCDMYTGISFYSACHAGCERMENLTRFSQCSCLPNGNISVVEGYCPTDSCSNGLVAFLVFVCLIHFLNGSGVVGRMLLSYKSIQADQRTAIIGLTLILISIFSVIPSPIVFGSLFESACLVREDMCSSESNQEGNCWLYNESTLRFAFNLSSAAILTLALIFDVVLWKNQDVEDLRIYDGELRQLTSHAHSSSTNQPNSNFATVSLS